MTREVSRTAGSLVRALFFPLKDQARARFHARSTINFYIRNNNLIIKNDYYKCTNIEHKIKYFLIIHPHFSIFFIHETFYVPSIIITCNYFKSLSYLRVKGTLNRKLEGKK